MSACLNIRPRRAVAAVYAVLAAVVTALCLWRISLSPGVAPWLLPLATLVVAGLSLGVSGRVRLAGGKLEAGPFGLRRTVNVADLAALSVEVRRGSRGERLHTLWLDGTDTLERRLGIALGFYPLGEVGALVRALTEAVPGVRLDEGARQLKERGYSHAA